MEESERFDFNQIGFNPQNRSLHIKCQNKWKFVSVVRLDTKIDVLLLCYSKPFDILMKKKCMKKEVYVI